MSGAIADVRRRYSLLEELAMRSFLLNFQRRISPNFKRDRQRDRGLPVRTFRTNPEEDRSNPC